MKPYIKRSQKDYSLSFKLSVVSQIERGELTFTQATKQYGIQCRSTVKNWFDRYSSMDRRAVCPTPNLEANSMKPETLTPEQRIKALEVELFAAQQKALLFETIVQVIRNEHPALLKKPLGKPQARSKSKKS
jgi:transposase-like protein